MIDIWSRRTLLGIKREVSEVVRVSWMLRANVVEEKGR